ncbi:MAG: ribokinase [Nitrospiraceae bacterium]
MPKVIVLGSANVDFTVAVDCLPTVGETVLGREFYQSFGGKGANQAVAAVRAGAGVVLLTMLGTDDYGRRIEQHLTALGLPREGLQRHPTKPTGVALILVDEGGRNLIAVAPGSNQMLSLEDVRRASPLIAQGAVLLAQLEVPLAAVQEAFSIAKAQGLLTILNPAPATPLPPALLKLVDVLTPNEGEANTLSEMTDPDKAARVLVEQGARSVIVTLGERGALLRDAATSRLFPAYPVQAIDSTAAGDAFNGALACSLAEGRSLEDAIVFANAAGALATAKRGAQESLPTRAEIDRLCHGSHVAPCD